MKHTVNQQGRAIPRSLLLMIQGCVAAVAMALLLLLWDHTLSSEETWALEVLFSLHAVWGVWSWRIATDRWLDGYSLFLLLVILFNGGQLLLDAVGLLPEGLLDDTLRSSTISRAVLLVVASVAAFHLGAMLCARPSASRARIENGVRGAPLLRRVGLIFLAVSAIPVMKRAVENVAVVAASGYFGLYQQEVKVGLSNWDAVLATFFMPGVLMVLGTSPKSKRSVGVCWALGVLNVVISLFLGFRAAAGMMIVPMMLIHHYLVKPFRRVMVLSVVTVAVFLVPWVAGLRTLTLQERLAAATRSERPAELAAVAGIKEMGGSMRTIAETIELIPSRREWDYGSGYLRALLTVVPNLFWDIHPTVKAGTYGDWLVREVDPILAGRGGGIGFSLIAEAYANASWLGAPFLMLLLGVLLGGLVAWARSKPPSLGVTFEALVLSAIMLLPRGETGTVVRALVWTTLIPYAVLALSGRTPRSRSRDRVPMLVVAPGVGEGREA